MAGTAVAVTTGGTTTPVLAPAAASFAGKLAITGTVILVTDSTYEIAAEARSNAASRKRHKSSASAALPKNGASSAAAGSPVSNGNNNDNDDGKNNNARNDSNKSAKDAKRIDGNSNANKFAQQKGYNDAHDFKDQVLKNANAKDKIVAHYDIYHNAKTGETFLKHKATGIYIPE